MKKGLCMILAAAMSLGLCVSASAADVASIDDSQMVVLEGPVTRAADVPSESHSLPYTASTEELQEGTTTLTRYYFTPDGTSFTVSGTVSSSGDKNNQARNAKLYLYELGSNELISTYEIPQFVGSTSFSTTFRNLSSNKNYYFGLKNTTTRPFPWTQSWWIDAEFTVE